MYLYSLVFVSVLTTIYLFHVSSITALLSLYLLCYIKKKKNYVLENQYIG